jgi:anti-sigma-K factor RskA
MRYTNRNLRRLLAGEYVLGTLRGAARRRFERLARTDAAVRAELRFWEIRLAALTARIAPVPAPPTVWISLQRRIEAGNTVPLRRAARVPKPAPRWRMAAGIAAAIAVAVVVMLNQKPPAPGVAQVQPAGPTYLAQIKLPDSDMHWTATLKPASGQMSVSAAGSYPQLGSHSLELWWISPQGPVAIGVLPTSGQGSMPLPKNFSPGQAITLAVSLEPVGGSPTGQPTGPVLTTAPAQAA